MHRPTTSTSFSAKQRVVAKKNNAWLSRRTAGLKLRNLIGRGHTRTAGVWALAAQTASTDHS